MPGGSTSHRAGGRRPVAGALLPFLALAALALPDLGARASVNSGVAVLAMGSAPRATPFPASHLGVRWHGDEEATIELRHRAEAQGWSQWRAVAVSHDLGDEERGVHLSGLIRAPAAMGVQVRATGDASRLEVVVIDAGPSPTAGERQPEVVTRAQWGADESKRKGTPEFAPLSKLVVHHTVTENDDPDPAATVRAVYAYHTQANGWNDIGYHFLIDAAGRIYEGRFARQYRPGETPTGEDESGRGVVGAHAKGANVGSVGVALLGDFRTTEPRPAALDALVRLLGWKAARHHIDPHGADPFTFTDGSTRSFPNLGGHRDVGTTACPGDRLYAHLPEIRDRVASHPGAIPGAPAPGSPPPPPLVPGYWAVSAEGVVEAVGDAPFLGSLAGTRLNAPVVSMAPTRSGGGYWLASSDGGVFAFGDARFSGSAALGPLDSSVVRLEPTPTGGGYWLVTANGGVLAFGDARFYGSALSLPEVKFVGMAATPTGEGYWLASSDGRVYAFGDALTGDVSSGRAAAGLAGDPRPTPIVSIAAVPSGRGYWLVARDGNVFAVEAPFRGRVPEGREVVQIRATESGEGYYVAGGDGAMFAFGDADGRRERSRSTGLLAVVDVAIRPLPPKPSGP
jgi:N-acetylmuramoyl-L-alanine amidase-like protein